MVTYLKSTMPVAQDIERLRAVRKTVADVIAEVRIRGDAAVREYSERFDGLVAATIPTRHGGDRENHGDSS